MRLLPSIRYPALTQYSKEVQEIIYSLQLTILIKDGKDVLFISVYRFKFL
jgi:hypothetical protein